jgi:anti-anti-sigma factor
VNDLAGGVEVRLRGNAGVQEADALEAVLLRLAGRRPACVIFDLRDLRFISSLAMGMLVAYRRAAVRAGGRVCLAADLQPAVRDALTRAQLISLFEAVGGREPGDAPAATDHPKPNLSVDHGNTFLTWAQLAELEPQLQTLLWQARAVGAGCRTPDDVSQLFRPVRNDLVALVGFFGRHHRHPILGSAGAYQVAYSKLYDAVAGLVRGRGNG